MQFYSRYGREHGAFGYPTSDAAPAHVPESGVGIGQSFERGSIICVQKGDETHYYTASYDRLITREIPLTSTDSSFAAGKSVGEAGSLEYSLHNHTRPASDEVRERVAELVEQASNETIRVRFSAPEGDLLSLDAAIWLRNVEDDGTFPGSKPAQMLRLSICSGRLSAGGDVSCDIPYRVATAWRTLLLPEGMAGYLVEAVDGPSRDHARGWNFAGFVVGDVGGVEVPDDFDWVTHRTRPGGMRVSKVDRTGSRVETVYLNPHFEPFYRPNTESRGVYWDLPTSPPPAATGLLPCFEVLARTIARRSVISKEIRPMSLRWVRESTAVLVVRRLDTGREVSIEIEIPAIDELAGRGYSIRPVFGDGGPAIKSPEQFAYGGLDVITRLTSIAISSGLDVISQKELRLMGPETRAQGSG